MLAGDLCYVFSYFCRRVRKISFILLVSYLVLCFNQYLPYFSYWANQEYIAKNLCENRDKPELKCNGKCHLAKELKKAAEKEKEPASNTTEKVEIIFFALLNELPEKAFQIEERTTHSFYWSCSSRSLKVSPDTPPPKA